MFSNLAKFGYSLYSFNTSTSMNLSSGTRSVLLAGFVILLVFAVVVMWRIFQKAGRPGWAALIPVYNTWVLFEISDKPGWWSLICIAVSFIPIPIIGSIVVIILYVLAMLELAKHFNKSSVFAIVGLVIFSIVGFAILAFSDAKYNPKA
jgi:small-conductance mechanosensitive channel